MFLHTISLLNISLLKFCMTKREEFLVFGQPDIFEEDIDEVVETLKSKWIGTGPKSRQLEQKIAEYIGVPYAVALNSCTAGLHLSLIASNIGPGDEVITTPMTFGATANVIHNVGATPIFADVDPNTMNISPEELESKVTSKTRAIIPVHFAGRPCNMDPLSEIASNHNLTIIEDAAHAIGAEYKGTKIGALGNLTCFSFYATKNITTGDGGIVTTPDKNLAKTIRILSNHGQDDTAFSSFQRGKNLYKSVVAPGFKYTLTDIHAALGLKQVGRLNSNLRRREEIWGRYNQAFHDLPLETPPTLDQDSKHAHHLYTLLLNLKHSQVDRGQLKEALYVQNIGTGIHYLALHLHPFYKKAYDYKVGDFPNAESISSRTISLPLSSALTDQDVDDVISAVRNVFKKYSR
jgi:dTDP-4-amino-4,6-dideoxygalactose transaminase